MFAYPPLQQSNSFKYKQNLKKDKKRFKMYDFDFVIINHKHITSSCLRIKKNLLFQLAGRILSWTIQNRNFCFTIYCFLKVLWICAYKKNNIFKLAD